MTPGEPSTYPQLSAYFRFVCVRVLVRVRVNFTYYPTRKM